MRTYNEKHELTAVVCNQCGRKLSVEHDIIKEGFFHGDTLFGYFSDKDGQHHTFDLCEDCYDKLVEGFAVPEDVEERTELL